MARPNMIPHPSQGPREYGLQMFAGCAGLPTLLHRRGAEEQKEVWNI